MVRAEILTPRLDIHSDNGLGSELGLVVLLLLVLSKALLTDASSLGVLLLVVRAEQVDIILVLLGGGGLGGVHGELSGLRSVDGVGLGRITGEGGEVALVGGDVLVPSGGVGVLLGIRSGLKSLEGGNVGLGRSGAVPIVSGDVLPKFAFARLK